MQTLKLIQSVVACMCFSAMTGCITIDPFENFKTFNRLAVGKSIQDRWVTGGVKPLSITQIANGNDEYRFERNMHGRRPSCIEIFEVNPKTGIVVRSSFEGDEKGCVIIP
jgi:hypothetical protein